MALRNQPYIPLYIQDFLTDENLNECSPGATGVYVKIMCILHKCEVYGSMKLKAKYKQNLSKIKAFAIMLDKQMSFSVEDIEKALNELIDEKVLHLEGDTLYQKRMVKDGQTSLNRAIGGSKGGKKSKIKTSKTKAPSENENEIEIEIEINKGIAFEKFWNLYDKKNGKKNTERKWGKLAEETKKQIMDHLPGYISSTPDKVYRKNPETYLNQESWNDEIITKNGKRWSFEILPKNLKKVSDEEKPEFHKALRENGYVYGPVKRSNGTINDWYLKTKNHAR